MIDFVTKKIEKSKKEKDKDKAFEYFLDQISELDKDRRRWYGL